MKQVFVVSSWLQLLSISTAVRNERIASAEERVLIVSDTRAVNEVGASFAEQPISAPLLDVFDRVIDYNSWIWPQHPSQWSPRVNEHPMWSKALLRAWNLADCHVQLFIESVQGNPARALSCIFTDAEIFVHSDGLMTYGPTRSNLPPQLWQRLSGLIYMDLVPGVDPLLLSEFADLDRIALGPTELRAEVERVAAAVDTSELRVHEDACMIVGQYLADVSLFTLEQETELYEQMIDQAISSGHRHIYLKPHPSASQSIQSALQHRARLRGVSFDVVPAYLPVELAALVLTPNSIYSCFSTGMVTAWRLFGISARAFGTRDAMEEFRPFENSNRIPVTICDYLFTDGTSDKEPLQEVVNAVSYCMRAQILPHLRGSTADFLHRSLPQYRHCFKRRRLTKLRLPGSLPPPSRAQQVRSLGRRTARSGLGALRSSGQLAQRTADLLSSQAKRIRQRAGERK